MAYNFLNTQTFKQTKLFLSFNKNKKYAPILFFAGGFIWDWLTLGRVDRLYDMVLLFGYFVLLNCFLFLFNTVDTLKWQQDFLKKYKSYYPLFIQFFLGGLTSAYVIYFSKSVSLSKAASFFIILIILLFVNEIFKKRISNIYFQFTTYAFVSFTFFACMIPVLIAKMNTLVFMISGFLSLIITFCLIQFIYKINDIIKAKINKKKLLGLVFSVYIFIGVFYVFKLIPPVPLALNEGLVAHDIQKINGSYEITYETDDWYVFWRDHKANINIENLDKIYVFTSIFAPTHLDKKVFHQWKKYNPFTKSWDISDKIGFEITGGRDEGYRGFTFKQNISEGDWEVEVITEEGLIIGIVDFTLESRTTVKNRRIKTRIF